MCWELIAVFQWRVGGGILGGSTLFVKGTAWWIPNCERWRGEREVQRRVGTAFSKKS